jgi:hypothetical protein
VLVFPAHTLSELITEIEQYKEKCSEQAIKLSTQEQELLTMASGLLDDIAPGLRYQTHDDLNVIKQIIERIIRLEGLIQEVAGRDDRILDPHIIMDIDMFCGQVRNGLETYL